VRKVFSKPVRIDALLHTIGAITGLKFRAGRHALHDDAHVNDNIIFIEVAKGLNREKIDLLSFNWRSSWPIRHRECRVLLMMSDLSSPSRTRTTSSTCSRT
jgi:hypothetical protein